ncbi:hypothetical protein A2436_00450 [candidate division WS6 bacterium RIFOXYC1_FULL_33_9]|nr:MAG: hypothetical protein A2369_02910 [candidate division WS6 bacterium RIFOXYB1_FULL_33_15]OGC37170.1 MAG: hypothetical protein A2436_00450 [candidate division WS6 bacterium RIFOXYC1_FULL_33_9]
MFVSSTSVLLLLGISSSLLKKKVLYARYPGINKSSMSTMASSMFFGVFLILLPLPYLYISVYHIL